MDRVEAAVSAFDKGLACSQAILSTYGERFGLDREAALRLAAGFGGGIGRMANTCGAVTGGVMVLGLTFDVATVKKGKGRDEVVELVREFLAKFTARNGSLLCRDLVGCDISSTEGLRLAREKKLFSTICPKFVRDAAEILEELLGEMP